MSGAAERNTVLCVDDEPQVLEGMGLTLGRRYQLFTATRGAAGLELIRRHPQISVVLSDMRMPEMDGARFLAQARALLPDATRILLTGYSELSSAIAAVNEGQIFRFLTKPCAPPDLLAAVEAAVRQHELLTAERVLLEQTLQGSLRALTDVLALASPLLFGRATRVKELAAGLAQAVQLPERWQLEIAALLAHIGMITLPTDVAEKVCYGGELEANERSMLERVPAATDRLLAHIPRLQVVRQMIAWRDRPFRRSEYIQPNRDEALAAHGAQILKVALDYDAQVGAGQSASTALGYLRSHADRYDPDVLAALAALQPGEDAPLVHEVPLAGLKPGMVFAEDVRTSGGVLLVTSGTEVTPAFLERIHNYKHGTLKTPLRVTLSAADKEAALESEAYVR